MLPAPATPLLGRSVVVGLLLAASINPGVGIRAAEQAIDPGAADAGAAATEPLRSPSGAPPPLAAASGGDAAAGGRNPETTAPQTSALLTGGSAAHGATVAAAPSGTATTATATAGAYLRLGGGLDWGTPTGIDDQDCSSTKPPALFGCGRGYNGASLQADGSFGQTPVLEGALGYRFTPWLRAEALLSWRPQLEFEGNSTFVTAGPVQPVSGALSSLAGFGVAYVDLPRVAGVQPFLGAGLGVARNRLQGLEFRFPAIASDASTSTAGGSRSNLAWLLTAGIAIPLSDRLNLDVAYRFTDLGTVIGASGPATIVRPRGTFELDIAGTEAQLQTQGLQIGLRYAF